MKRVCPCCNKKFVFNKRKRKEEISMEWLPDDTEKYCYPCIKDIASIEAEVQAEFWAQGASTNYE